MPLFTYTAVDARGAAQSGRVEAADLRQATRQLRQAGLFPTGIVAAGKAIVGPALTSGNENAGPARSTRIDSFRWLRRNRRVGKEEAAQFTRQLATLLRAGLPLLRSLEVLGRQQRNPALQQVLADLTGAIKSGGTLSEAMGRHPRIFGRLYLNMVKAGEAGGTVDLVLDRLARFQEKSLQLRSKVTSAMVYPLIVLAVAGAILVGLLVFVVPKFKQIFADLLKGAPLPPLTQWVLTVSDAARSHYLLVAAVGGVVWAGWQLAGRTERGSRWRATVAVRLPVFGDLLLKDLVARFGRTLGTLLASGVPILPALLITRDTCGNRRVAQALTAVHDRVKEGASLARPLDETRAFPPLVASMVEVGEQTGQLPEMLGKVADIYEAEVDNAVAGLSALIEPVLILFLAGVVGTIVIALFLPIVRIVQLLT